MNIYGKDGEYSTIVYYTVADKNFSSCFDEQFSTIQKVREYKEELNKKQIDYDHNSDDFIIIKVEYLKVFDKNGIFVQEIKSITNVTDWNE